MLKPFQLILHYGLLLKPGVVFVLLSLFSFSVKAQNEHFERDSVSYFEYTIDMMKQLPRDHKKMVKAFEASFEDYWYGGNVTDQQRDTIYGFTNQMMNERFKVYPTFYQYLHIIETLTENDDFFRQWHNAAKASFVNEKYQDVINLISSSYRFFDDKTMYAESSINWRVVADTFRFVYQEAPRFEVERGTLMGFSQTDTLSVVKTSGKFDVLDKKWFGSGGRVYWERAGYDSSRIKTILHDYEVDLTSPFYETDSVIFYDNRIFDEPITGSFKDGYMYVFDSTDIWYPKFQSDQFYRLEKLLEDVVLNGYLSYEGDKVIVESDPQNKASAEMMRNNDRYLSIFGDRFFVKKDRFFSKNTSVSIYIEENDSIYHPSINFEYNPVQDELLLLPRSKQNILIPYSNSYHNMDMYCRMMEWDIRDSVLRFSELTGMDQRGSAIFESHDYYSKQRFYNIQMNDVQNPLMILNNFMVETDLREFKLNRFVEFSEFNDYQSDLLMQRLASEGFVIYDRKNRFVKIKDKVLNYINAWYGVQDYDVMRFISRVEGSDNAELNLKNSDLDIKGIPVVYLSDSQRVFIYPRGNRILMKENRDFEFAGRLIAGNLQLFGESGYFSYDDFNIDLPTVDSMRISVTKRRKDGSKYLSRVNTVLENLDGELQIDKPDNKAGLKKAPRHPILNSEKEASAFYDKYARYKGVYDRERFEYHVYPFEIDSVDNFRPEALSFDGFLESSIFPEIHKPITIQEDNSLGFKTTTPEDGFEAYGGKGVFYDSLFLSNEGLQGKGELQYLASDAKAREITFFPDSARGPISAFHLKEMTHPTQYPLVKVDSAKMRWLQTKDSMIVYEPSRPFAMYQDQVSLEGLIALTPEALKGKGVANYDLASVSSDEFAFRNTDFQAEESDVNIATSDGQSTAVDLENYSTNIDVANRSGNFLSEEEGSTITFPYNEYISYLNEVEWDVSEKILNMNVGEIDDLAYLDTLDYKEIVDEELSGARFVSTKESQDSLQFFALEAKYDLSASIIEAEKVKYINVADAAVFPFEERLRIGRDAAIETLRNARILASIENKAHYITGATVELQSRHKYEGEGFYQYEDAAGESFEVYFPEITVEDEQTAGNASIGKTDNFRLGPAFDYYGNLELSGADSMLTYDGYFRLLKGECSQISEQWVKFNEKLAKSDIRIPIEHPVEDTADVPPVYASLHFSPNQQEIYPRFFEPEVEESDYPFWTLDGVLSYADSTNTYSLAANRAGVPDSLQAYYRYDPDNCSFEGLATLDFQYLFGRMDVIPRGTFSYNLTDDEFAFRGVLSADFLFAGNALSAMADTLNSYDLDRVDPSEKWYEKAVGQILNPEELQGVVNQVNLYGMVQEVPEKLRNTLFFNDVSFQWNQQLNSFVASGELGIGNVGGEAVGRFVTGVIEIQPTEDGGNLNIYLEPEDGKWYFFTYSGSLMESVSFDKVFNEEIDEVKRSKRFIPAKDGVQKYEYGLSGLNLKEFFLQRIQEAGVRFR
ncbi:MAG: hypothetical protein ACQESX_03100 [Bacteroidota bacterium]